jgi:4-hydroxy-tetrahydrodipicolinate synthase
METNNSNKLRGVICPMVTPLDEHENIDEAGVRKLVSRLIDKGVDGIFLLGSMGEFPMIVEEEKERLIQITVDEAKGRVPVMANVSAEGPRKTERMMRKAIDAGTDLVVLVPPYFYNVRDEREIKQYYITMSRNSDKPLVIYNIPVYTNNPIPPGMVVELSEEPNIVGIKADLFANLPMFRQLRGRDDFATLHGNEGTLDLALELGADGIIPGISSLAADRCVELYRKAREGDTRAASKQQLELANIQEAVFGKKAAHWGTGHKYALSLLGLCQPFVATTLLPLDERQKEQIAAAVSEYGLS